MAKQTKKSTTEYSNSYKHGNLMMASTMIGMCTLLVVMLLSTAFKSANSVNTAFTVCKTISGGFFISFIWTGILSFTKNKSLLEYCIYSLVMSVGFLALCGTSAFLFLPKKVNFINAVITTRNAQAGLIVVNIVYMIWTFIYHTIKSDHKK